MDELMDMIVADESPSQISDKIKDILFAKSAERIDAFRPVAANSLFGDDSGLEIEDGDTEIDGEADVDDVEDTEE